MAEKATYGNVVNAHFISACNDYFYLIDRHFPERSVLKLVGDRYKLTGDQRTILYRGISSRLRSENRRNKLTTKLSECHLLVDGYNVLFTLLNYRMGKPVFVSTDGLVRDAGSLHGKLRDEKTFHACMDLLTDFLVRARPLQISVYLDSPVSHSEKHARMMMENLHAKGLAGEAFVIRSADWALAHADEGVIATSDTAIIERVHLPVADLPRYILQDAYSAVFLEMGEMVKSL